MDTKVQFLSPEFNTSDDIEDEDSANKNLKFERTLSKMKREDYREFIAQGHSLETPMSFIKIPPEKGVELYFTSLQTTKLEDMPIYEGEFTNSEFTKAKSLDFKNERDEWLKENKKHAIFKRILFDRKWEKLRKKQTDLKQAFQQYSIFIYENQEKRKRSLQRLQHLQEVQKQHSLEFTKLKEKYTKVAENKDLLENMIHKYSLYEDYLNNVVVASNHEFKSPFDMITRFEALMESKKLILNQQEDLFLRLNNAYTAFRKMNEDCQSKLIGLMNEVNELYVRHEYAKDKVIQQEILLGLVYDYAMRIKSTMNQVKGACMTIYEFCSNRKKSRVFVNDDDVNGQLIFIKRAIKDVQDITEVLRMRGEHGKDHFM